MAIKWNYTSSHDDLTRLILQRSLLRHILEKNFAGENTFRGFYKEKQGMNKLIFVAHLLSVDNVLIFQKLYLYPNGCTKYTTYEKIFYDSRSFVIC